MLLPRITSLLLTAGAVSAFQNTSPFLLLSSDPLSKHDPLQSAQLGLTKDVSDRLIDTLSACDKKWYYIFSQEHVNARDLRDGAMPRLQKRVAGAQEGSVVQIPEVVQMGELSARSVVAQLEEACAVKGKRSVESWPESSDEYRIINVNLPSLPTAAEARIQAVRDTDDAIDDTVASVLEKEQSAILLYLTTPPVSASTNSDDSHLYEMDDPYPSGLHTDLKRDVLAQKRQSDDNYNMQAGLPLFETYQFLSPALFMGLGVSLFLLLILWVGISAVAGLEVSYMAFSKEMGPQKPKQQ